MQKKMTVKEVPVAKCFMHDNSRLDVVDEDLSSLMTSIKESGLLQPIGVTPATDGKFEIIYGNRRYQAIKKLGWKTIPAIVHPTADGAELDIKNLVENIQRENLSVREIGRYIDRLVTEQDFTLKEVAAYLGRSYSFCSNAQQTFKDVPEQFRKDVKASVSGKPLPPGSIGINAISKIEAASRRKKLTKPQRIELYKMAKREGFDYNCADEYAEAIKNKVAKTAAGILTKVNDRFKTVRVTVKMNRKEYDRISQAYVVEDDYSSVPDVLTNILTGELDDYIELYQD